MAINDKFGGTTSLEGPAEEFTGVTPSNDDLPFVPRLVFVGTGGDLLVMSKKGGAAVTFKNVAAGTTLIIRPLRILPGTTAADIVICA
jgi:hypothetical protein